MLLEQDNKKILRMLDDKEYLNMEVNKALGILKTQPWVIVIINIKTLNKFG